MEETLAVMGQEEPIEGTDGAAHGYAPVQWARKKIALAVAVGVVVAALSLGCAAALCLHTIDLALTGGMDVAQQDDLAEALQPPKSKAAAPDATAEEANEPAFSAYYVATLGCDARPNETIARSDVIVLARIDTETGVVHLVSVPRDMMVEIEGHGPQKINVALAFGGPAGAVRVLSAFAGVPITHYVELRFEQLVELVDRLGGVTVDVPEGFTSDTSGISYVGTMYDEWRAMMQRVDAGLDPADESVEIPEPQAGDENLGAAVNARSPRDYSGRIDQAGFKDN